jgi:hypothetical protein
VNFKRNGFKGLPVYSNISGKTLVLKEIGTAAWVYFYKILLISLKSFEIKIMTVTTELLIIANLQMLKLKFVLFILFYSLLINFNFIQLKIDRLRWECFCLVYSKYRTRMFMNNLQLAMATPCCISIIRYMYIITKTLSRPNIGPHLASLPIAYWQNLLLYFFVTGLLSLFVRLNRCIWIWSFGENSHNLINSEGCCSFFKILLLNKLMFEYCFTINKKNIKINNSKRLLL